jgi:hypothetical protein
MIIMAALQSIAEILVNLAKHGCLDITPQLDTSKTSDFPESKGGYDDVYTGALHNGNRVSLKCLSLRVDSTDDGRKQLKVRVIYVSSDSVLLTGSP